MENKFSVWAYPFDDRMSEGFFGEDEICVVGFYGDKETVCCALGKFFTDEFEGLSDENGLFLVKGLKDNKVALVVSFGKNLKVEQDLETCYLISVLLKLCKTVVPCISKYSVQRWYYSEKALLYSQFTTGFSSISIDKRHKISMVFEDSSTISHKDINFNSSFFSKNSLYTCQDPQDNTKNHILYKKLRLDLITEIFEESKSIEKVQKIFEDFLNNIDEMVYCSVEVLEKLLEDLKDLVIVKETSAGEAIASMCKNIKKEMFEGSVVDLSVSSEVKNFSIIDHFQEQLLKSKKRFKEIYIKSQFEKLVISKLLNNEQEHAQSLIKVEIQMFRRRIEKINQDIIFKAEEKFKVLKPYFINTSFKILKSVILSTQQGLCYKQESQYIISSAIYLGELKNLIELDDLSILCLFENTTEGSSILFICSFDGNLVQLPLNSLNFEVAVGSNHNFIILTNNSTQTISAYTQKNGEFFLSFEKKVSIFMNFPHYLQKTNKVMFINDKKQLFLCEIQEKSVEHLVDLSAFAINTACFNEEFLSISVSNNEEIIAIQLRSKVLILNRVLLIQSQIEVKENQVKKIFVSNLKNECFLVIVHKASSSFYKIKMSDSGPKSIYSNQIIDIVEHSAKLFFDSQSLACTQIFAYIKSGYAINTIKDYYSTLAKSKKLFKYRGILPDQMDDLFIKYDSNTLKAALLQTFTVKLAKLRNFCPYLNKNSDSESSFNQGFKTASVYHLKETFFYHFFESEIKKLDSVIVIGIIGLNLKYNTQILQSIFSVHSFPLDQGNISMYFSQSLGKKFVIIVATLPSLVFNNSLLNTFEFISAVSDRIILNLQYSELDKAHLMLNQFFFSQSRINESTFYKFKLDLVVFDGKTPTTVSNVYDYIKKLPQAITIVLLSPVNSVSFLAESRIYLKKLTQTPCKYSGSRFFTVLKTVLAQVYTGDCHPIQYWDNFVQEYLNKPKDSCELNGVCDTVIKSKGNSFFIEPITLESGHSNTENCEEKCGHCGSYCELKFGHIGYHSVKRHDNLNGFRCDVRFFYDLMENMKFGLTWVNTQTQKWHQKMWETPYESIFGLI